MPVEFRVVDGHGSVGYAGAAVTEVIPTGRDGENENRDERDTAQ